MLELISINNKKRLRLQISRSDNNEEAVNKLPFTTTHPAKCQCQSPVQFELHCCSCAGAASSWGNWIRLRLEHVKCGPDINLWQHLHLNRHNIWVCVVFGRFSFQGDRREVPRIYLWKWALNEIIVNQIVALQVLHSAAFKASVKFGRCVIICFG